MNDAVDFANALLRAHAEMVSPRLLRERNRPAPKFHPGAHVRTAALKLKGRVEAVRWDAGSGWIYKVSVGLGTDGVMASIELHERGLTAGEAR